jgi:ABC-type sugar transport system ATPase subunit
MTVAQNMAFPLKIRKKSAEERNVRVKELAGLLSIKHLLDRKPAHLSGGEKQRVALGRALSFYPQIICMDEPLSALDDKTKMDIVDLILKLKEKMKITVLHISHNLKEVEILADKILHLKDKKLVYYPAEDFFSIKDRLL